MYQMYPEWGPAKHRSTEDRDGARRALDAVQRSLDPRDAAGERPDDN